MSAEKKPRKKYQARKGFKLTVGELSSPELKTEQKEVQRALNRDAKKLTLAQQGKFIKEPQSVDHAQRVANSLLVETMNSIGLDAKSMAEKLKYAIEASLRTGKTAMNTQTRELEIVPDLRAFKDLAALWGIWMKVGRVGAIQQQNNFFGASGLDEAGRQTVAGFVERIEAEAKRRGLPGIHAVSAEPEDAAPLPGVDESGGDESAPAD